jgi:hypothetical protein
MSHKSWIVLALLGTTTLSGPLLAQTMTPDTTVGGTTGGTVTGTTGTGTTTGTAPTMTTDPNAGAFDRLSPGGQKIARSLYDSQTPAAAPVSGTPSASSAATGTGGMTLDQIAAAKSGTGWGQVFKDMQAQNLTQAKNLGEVVSGRYTPPAPTTAGETATGTTGSSGTLAVTPAPTTGSTAPSSTRTAAASGHGKSVVITNGSGRTVSTGHAGKLAKVDGSSGRSVTTAGGGHAAGSVSSGSGAIKVAQGNGQGGGGHGGGRLAHGK